MEHRDEILTYAKQRAAKHLENQMWLAAWISFKADMQKHADLKSHAILSLGDTLAGFLLDASLGIPAGTDEALAMKVYCNQHIKAMIEAAK